MRVPSMTGRARDACDEARGGNSSQTDAEQLLQDIPVLQEWQRASSPSNKVRDAMMKLGTHWNVPQKTNGKKRAPAAVAKDMEDNMLKKGRLVLITGVEKPSDVAQDMEKSMLKRARLVPSSSVSKLATQSDNSPEEKKQRYQC